MIEIRGYHLHFQHDLPSINIDLLSIRVFNRRVVTLDPDILHKLGGETAFADSSYCSRKLTPSQSSSSRSSGGWGGDCCSPRIGERSMDATYLYRAQQCDTLSCLTGGLSAWVCFFNQPGSAREELTHDRKNPSSYRDDSGVCREGW